jgi:hypothetical protein
MIWVRLNASLVLSKLPDTGTDTNFIAKRTADTTPTTLITARDALK